MNFAQLKLLWAMTLFEAQRFKAYPHEIFASLGARFAELALYCTFWLVIAQFNPGQTINPVDIISYYFIVSGFVPFLYAGYGFAAMTIEMIKSGQLNQVLIRPVNPMLYPLAIRTGRNAVSLVFGVLQIAFGMILAGGMQAEALPFLLPALWNAFAINIAINILIGTVGFYTTEGRGIKNTCYHIATFARGEKMPLFLMTPAMAGFLSFTPFPASQYHLAILFQGNHLPAWGDILIGLGWSIVLIVTSVALWKRGLRRYEAIGL